MNQVLNMALCLAAGLLLWACGPKEQPAKQVLDEKEKSYIREKLADMKGQVELVSFVGPGFATCGEAVALYEEIAREQPKVVHESHDIEKDRSKAQAFGISWLPAVVIKKGKDAGLRYFGLPKGYEFPTFIDTIGRVSRDEPNISAAAAVALAGLKVPVTIKVFVVPS